METKRLGLTDLRCVKCGGEIDLIKQENVALFDDLGKPHVLTTRSVQCMVCAEFYGTIWCPWAGNPTAKSQNKAVLGIIEIDDSDAVDDDEDGALT
jgi:hypothetical protein